MIPHSRPRFEQTCFDAVKRVLTSGKVTAGNEVRRLESEVVALGIQSHAVAVDSGTSALMLAIRALKGGCEKFVVGIPAYTCASVLHAVIAADATPICIDCDFDLRLHRNKAIAAAKQLDAVVIVHPFGYSDPCVSDDWPCPVIEDIAQAAGGVLHGRLLGSFGNLSIASFYATKPWGGAYGGMVLSHDERMIQRIRCMCRYDNSENFRNDAGPHQLSELHAVLARMRLNVAARERHDKKKVAHIFNACFADSECEPVTLNSGNSYYRYIVRCKDSAEEVISHFRANDVYACKPVQKPISTILGDHSCLGAESAWRDCVSIPLLDNFSPGEIQQVREVIQTTRHIRK